MLIKNEAGEDVEVFTAQELEAKLAETAKKAAEDATAAAKDHITKLNEENKNKRLTNKEILEALGVTKEDGKTDIELVKETLAAQNKTIEQLQQEAKDAKAEKELVIKKSKAAKIAQDLNFNNPEDVFNFIDVNTEDLEGAIKGLAESRKYLLNTEKKNVGGPFNAGGGANPEVEDELTKAFKAGAGV